ncbi:oligosaccharide flippase family protein [Providencia rettgeri]|uniref:oligosaccharide flippase family protein n=1 Tax=Providencia rettgeri TaxID=587 RepID=UPI003015AB4B
MLKKNILNLFTNQIFSYIVPLLLLPYLSRSLSIKYLGLYVLSLSFVNFGSVIINYGFDISIAKKIAEGENTKLKISQFLYNVNAIKLILSFLTTISIVVVNLITDYFNNLEILIICLTLISTSFNLNWLFQGLEKIYIVSRVTIFTRLISISLIFLTVKDDSDFIYLLTINFFQAFIALIIAYLIIFNWGISPLKTDIKSTVHIAKDSTEYFISRLGVSLYSTSCSFFLGIFGGSLQQVAIYGVAEQLYRAGISALSAVSTPLTPYMARTKNYNVFFKLVTGTIFITLLGGSIGIIYGTEIIKLIFGNNYIQSKQILDIFMLTIPISVLGMLFGYPALIPLRKTKIANFSVIYAGILQLVLIFLFLILNINLTAMTVVFIYFICESLVLLIRLSTFIYSYRNKKNPQS